MKRLLSLVLAFALVLTCGAFVASAESDNYIQIKWAAGNGSADPTDTDKVLEALNEISREAIGVELDIDFMTSDMLSLSINAGEVYDIYFTCSWMNETNKAISNGLFLGLTQEYIEEVAPGFYSALPKSVWDIAESADGKVYAIPNFKDYAAENFITYPVEVAEKLGYEIPDHIDSWSELTDFLVAWKETMADNEYPIMLAGTIGGMDTSFDYISRTPLIGCSYGTTEVKFVLEDEDVRDRVETVADWYAKGLINPDCLTTESVSDSIQYCHFVQAWDGYDGYSSSWGYEVGMTRFSGPVLNVDSIQGSMNALSASLEGNEEKIDACLKLFELMFTNKLYADTLAYGVQGYHWDYVTEGNCAGAVVQYEAGSNNYAPWRFSMPNYFYQTISVSTERMNSGATPNLTQYETYNEVVAESAIPSAMGGFKWDSSKWESQLKEISNIKEKYWDSIITGTTPIDDVYDEFIAAMNAAGLQEIIDDAQEQLDAYLAAN